MPQGRNQTEAEAKRRSRRGDTGPRGVPRPVFQETLNVGAPSACTSGRGHRARPGPLGRRRPGRGVMSPVAVWDWLRIIATFALLCAIWAGIRHRAHPREAVRFARWPQAIRDPRARPTRPGAESGAARSRPARRRAVPHTFQEAAYLDVVGRARIAESQDTARASPGTASRSPTTSGRTSRRCRPTPRLARSVLVAISCSYDARDGETPEGALDPLPRHPDRGRAGPHRRRADPDGGSVTEAQLEQHVRADPAGPARRHRLPHPRLAPLRRRIPPDWVFAYAASGIDVPRELKTATGLHPPGPAHVDRRAHRSGR